MLQRVAVLNVVGLSRGLLPHAPRIMQRVRQGRVVTLEPPLPAVTTTVQASMVTGLPPAGHGIVANGWYDRETCEVRFWQRSNHLVQGEQLWDAARRRDSTFTCANLFWWYNSYSTCDYVVQARPIYKADGRKMPDCYTHPDKLRDRLQAPPPEGLGTFPLFRFWGPGAGVESSRWIAAAAAKVHREHSPTLLMVYLPHLDYPLQRVGPGHESIPGEVAAIDAVVGGLLDELEGDGVTVLILSEYGIEPCVGGDASIAVNAELRGLLAVREEDGLEVLDAGACRAFAVADHAVAHVYVRNPADIVEVVEICSELEGVESCLGRTALRDAGVEHERGGDLLLVAEPGRWFRYDYWLDDARAPDYARTVDIHRKPGYDPRELFLDPALPLGGKLRVARRLAGKRLGFRSPLDVIPLDASMVRGTHGRARVAAEHEPVMILPPGVGAEGERLPSEAVKGVVLDAMFGD